MHVRVCDDDNSVYTCMCVHYTRRLLPGDTNRIGNSLAVHNPEVNCANRALPTRVRRHVGREVRGSNVEGGGHDGAVLAVTELALVERVRLEDTLCNCGGGGLEAEV